MIKVKRKGDFLQKRSDSKKGVGPKKIFKTLWLNFLSQIAIYSFTIISQIKETSKVISLQWNETHNRGRLKLDTWRLSFTYINNQKHSRMKIFAKITSRQMGSWSRTFLTYHDICTGLRERSVLNYFARRLPSVTTACIWNIYSASKICGSHYDCPLTDCNEYFRK